MIWYWMYHIVSMNIPIKMTYEPTEVWWRIYASLNWVITASGNIFGVKPLPEPMLIYYHWGWKCRLQKFRPFSGFFSLIGVISVDFVYFDNSGSINTINSWSGSGSGKSSIIISIVATTYGDIIIGVIVFWLHVGWMEWWHMWPINIDETLKRTQ